MSYKKMRSLGGLLLTLYCLVYSSLPTQAAEGNNDPLEQLLPYGDYFDTDLGSGMDEENTTIDSNSTEYGEVLTELVCTVESGENSCYTVVNCTKKTEEIIRGGEQENKPKDGEFLTGVNDNTICTCNEH